METKNHPPDNANLTRQQQNALHLFYELLSKEFQKEGITMTTVLSKFVIDTPATKYTVKELMWKPLQLALTGKESTTKLLKKEEIDLVYESINKFTSENWGIHIPFPSQEE